MEATLDFEVWVLEYDKSGRKVVALEECEIQRNGEEWQGGRTFLGGLHPSIVSWPWHH